MLPFTLGLKKHRTGQGCPPAPRQSPAMVCAALLPTKGCLLLLAPALGHRTPVPHGSPPQRPRRSDPFPRSLPMPSTCDANTHPLEPTKPIPSAPDSSENVFLLFQKRQETFHCALASKSFFSAGFRGSNAAPGSSMTLGCHRATKYFYRCGTVFSTTSGSPPRGCPSDPALQKPRSVPEGIFKALAPSSHSDWGFLCGRRFAPSLGL